MSRCMYCYSRFFKLLETRFMLLPKSKTGVALFSKKRCKRCKMKSYYRQDLPSGSARNITGELWYAHVGQTQVVADAGRFTIFASEYSKRMSRGVQYNGDCHVQSA